MQKYSVFIFYSVFFLLNQAFPVSGFGLWKGSKSAEVIDKAMDYLQKTDGKWAYQTIQGNNITKQPIEIAFKNMVKLGPHYATDDAVTWKTEDNKLTIYLNEKHKMAPAQAISALLAHESIHQDLHNSIMEETYGHGYEAEVWLQLQHLYPELKTIPHGSYELVDRLNELSKKFMEGGYTTSVLEEYVRSHKVYHMLPEVSEGFEK